MSWGHSAKGDHRGSTFSLPFKQKQTSKGPHLFSIPSGFHSQTLCRAIALPSPGSPVKQRCFYGSAKGKRPVWVCPQPAWGHHEHSILQFSQGKREHPIHTDFRHRHRGTTCSRSVKTGPWNLQQLKRLWPSLGKSYNPHERFLTRQRSNQRKSCPAGKRVRKLLGMRREAH